MIKDLIIKNRSYRRFDQTYLIKTSILRELVELARFSPSAANLQPLKYIFSNDDRRNKIIFPYLSWAGYLKDWPEPEEGEKPSAYIIILGDNEIRHGIDCDHGIAAQSILLGAVEKELGGCIIGSIKKDELKRELNIPSHLDILLIIALGKHIEHVKLETVQESGDIKYWRDEMGVHHVPKRSLNEIIIG
ncbi:MAG: nitroreductase family protein [Bacteroidales bacterium]|nr:nitroreductase family protein [Bacteroidales bacterium]